MLKEMKSGRKYFIINIDEPYAEKIYEALKAGQMAKGEWPEGDISFEEWKRQTFGDNDFRPVPDTDDIPTKLTIKVDGITVEYGRIPGNLIKGWNNIVYYFQTRDAYNTETHERVVKKVIDQLESQSVDHWAEWRVQKIEAVVWDEFCQITLVSFRVRDSY